MNSLNYAFRADLRGLQLSASLRTVTRWIAERLSFGGLKWTQIDAAMASQGCLAIF